MSGPPPPRIDVFVANEQSDVSVDEHRIVSLMRAAAAEEGVDARAELSVLLVGREAMAGLNEQWLGESGPTDVLAFPMDESAPDEGPFILGDVVICPDVAREQAAERDVSVVDEVDLLVVHGFLHLLGYDHVQPSDARAMHRKEQRILSSYRDQGV